jgi:uncharacterized secreted protein with C-terminal beta-propeller domain
MRIRPGLLAIGVLVALGASVTATAVTAAAPAPTRLRAFDSCPTFFGYVQKQALPLVGPWGFGGGVVGTVAVPPPGAARDAVAGTPAAPEPAFSGTNVQEEGVDEPDLVKTDGRRLFVVSDGRLSAVDVRSRRPRLLGTLRLETGWAHELLLHGNRLLVLSQGTPTPLPIDGPVAIRAPWPYPSRTTITEVDVSEPARLHVVRTLELDGGYLTARLVGRAARIVLSSPMATDLPFVRPGAPGAADTALATERNREVVRSSRVGSWLPGYTLRNAAGGLAREGRLVQCRQIRRPSQFAGLGLVTVLTFDVERGLDPIDSDAIVSDGRVVYASRSSLYVATERFDRRGGVDSGTASTAIHRFDISSPAQTHYAASGTLPGVLLSQWSLSERNGVLRVASTEVPTWSGGPRTESETTVTTLGTRAGALVPLGRVGGLGKGERVYAVRFVGDVGYVVTFRQVDPLYVIDLSTPSRPVVRGELKILGYSAYLHPVGDDLLLGIGQDATDDGRVLGAQASLFDVSDLRSPRRLDALPLGRGWSEAEQDHHAFLWWPRTRHAVIPIQSHSDRPFVGALGLRLRNRAISEVGRISHPGLAGVDPAASSGTPIRRSVVVGDVLYTVSASGVKASALETFADLGFARLPQPVQGPPPSR